MAVEPAGQFLHRLARSRRGNVLAIMAASLIPMVGMAGGGVDAARLYLSKTRLQQACDAAVLAGRRSMTGSSWTDDSKAVADQYFRANYTPGRYGTRSEAIAYAVGNDQIVHGTATVTVPMAMMQVLGFRAQTLTATCDAQLQVPNADIMFVLDTTLSMNLTNSGDTDSRIVALRKAVTSFYTSMENARGGNTQVRYGFVPYAGTVNVGALLKREWMVDRAQYQSRLYLGPTPTTGLTWTPIDNNWLWVSGTSATTTSKVVGESCATPASENYTDSTSYQSTGSGPPPTRKATRTQNGVSYSATRSANGDCTVTKNTYKNYVTTRNEKQVETTYTAQMFRYQPVTFGDVAVFKGSNADGTMAGGKARFIDPPFRYDNRDDFVVEWSNTPTVPFSTAMCIEERETIATSDPNTVPVRWENGLAKEPYDLDVDLIPDVRNDATRWRPFVPVLVFPRGVSNYYPADGNPTGFQSDPVKAEGNAFPSMTLFGTDYAACPSPSRKLKSKGDGLTADVLKTYLDGLKAAGHTYLDIGFLWGLRLMSPDGLFGTENAAAQNGGSIARHLIFMTDGKIETNRADYEAYGLSALDRRRLTPVNAPPSNDDQDKIVAARLSHLCSVAKDQKNITVWVIAFGDEATLSPLLTDCASPNRAFKAKNAAELTATFTSIAAQISQLRLTK